MKPVELKGYLDISKQVFVAKEKDKEKGVELIAPFYTHLDKDDKPCGVLVNRGWVPWDLHLLGGDKIVDITKIQGVLYQGDTKTRESKKNTPILNELFSAYPEELALLMNLPNE